MTLIRQKISFLFLLVIPIILFSQNSSNTLIKEGGGYTIDGYLPGLKDGEKVTMRLSSSKGYHSYEYYLSTRDSAYVKNGEFHLKGIVPDGPRRYRMEFDKHTFKEAQIKIIDLCIDNNEKITIRSDSSIDKIPHGYLEHHVSIEGSATNYSRFVLEPARLLYDQTLYYFNAIVQNTYDSLGFDGPRLDGIFAAKNALDKIFI